MTYKVVLVPFPFDDLAGQKVRPAVCLTPAIGPHRHIVLAFITSSSLAKLEVTDVALSRSVAGFSTTGLRVDSTLRLHRLITVSASIIIRQLGILPKNLESIVENRLRALFAL